MHVLFRLNRSADVGLRLREAMLPLATVSAAPSAASAAATAAGPGSAAAAISGAGSSFFSEKKEGKDGSGKSAPASDGYSPYTKNHVPLTDYAFIRRIDTLRSGPRLYNSFSFKRPVEQPPPPPPTSAPSAAPMAAAAAASSQTRPPKAKRVREFKDPTPLWCLPFTLLIGNPAERAQMLEVYGDHGLIEDMDLYEGEDAAALVAEMYPSPLHGHHQSLRQTHDPVAAHFAALEARLAHAQEATPLWYLCAQSATFASGKGVL